MNRQIVLITKEEHEVKKIERQKILHERNLQYKKTYKIKIISMVILVLISSLTIFLTVAPLFEDNNKTNSGSIKSGAKTMRASGMNKAEESFSHKYFNIEW
jgi:hypothetical protein